MVKLQTMKNKIILLLLFCNMYAYTQTQALAAPTTYPICYTYDGAGNRIYKGICIIVSDPGGPTVGLVKKVDKNLEELGLKIDDKSICTNLSDFVVYPNPSSGIFQLSDQQKWLDGEMYVFDASGSVVYSIRISASDFDLTKLSNGQYIITIQKEGNVNSGILIITK
jgi:hypothetical protein